MEASMSIPTTLCIRKDILGRVDALCKKSGMSRATLVNRALRLSMRKNYSPVAGRDAVRYQQSAPADSWRILHVRFGKDEYEFFTDMRKVFKMSVSLLLAYSIMNFYDDIIGTGKDEIKRDNYHFSHHVLTSSTTGTGICWKLYWLKPPNPMKN